MTKISRLLSIFGRAMTPGARIKNKKMETAGMLRFRIELRSGIVAVYDTHHPEYEDTPGCHADYPWGVAAWHGEYNKEAGYWEIEQWKIEKAYQLVSLLNGEEA